MTFEQACDLVRSEGCGEEGLVVGLRMGQIPSSERMSQLLAALKTVYRQLEGETQFERELVNALFGLTFHVQGEIDGMLGRGIDLPRRFVDTEMMQMFLIVESILEDEWMLD